MNIATQCIAFDCPNYLTKPSGKIFDYDNIDRLRGKESMTIEYPLEETFNSLNEIYQECSNPNWDGYGASPITKDAYEEAKKLLDVLPSLPEMPEITAEPNGEIGFEWYRNNNQVFVLSVNGRHEITYAGIFQGNKMHGSEYFDETIPSLIIQNLVRLNS